jgi:hypothetical protein
MISTTFIATFLAALTVVVHAVGFSLILRHFLGKNSAPPIQT